MEFDLWRPLAGLGLFLFSMSIIENALESLSGRAFRRFLRRNTERPLSGILSGTVATAVLQSSSLVGLMMLALVGAGVVQMRNALSVIFGANLGTTATGWIVATIGFKLHLDEVALPLIAVGGLSAIAIKDDRFRQAARITFAVGLLLMGLQLMKAAVGDIGEVLDLASLEQAGALQFLLFGVVFSALVQSSSATMMVTLSALHGGIIDLEAAVAVIIGADIGTTGTVLMGALKGTAAKKRVAVGHFMFNFVTGVVAFTLRVPLTAALMLFGLPDLLTLVAFHTTFNLMGIMLFVPVIGRFSDWLENRFEDGDSSVGRHLADVAIELPDAAVESIRLETNHLLQRVICQNLMIPEPKLGIPSGTLPVGLRAPRAVVAELEANFEDAYDASKRLEGEIITFSTDAQIAALDKDESDMITRCQFTVREAIQASKSLKDVHADLLTFAYSHRPVLNDYASHARDIMEEIYGQIFKLRHGAQQGEAAERGYPKLEDIIVLNQLAHLRHDEMHASIYDDVRAGRLDKGSISSLLNVNRELFNSNRSLLAAIATATLPPDQVETLELLPASAV
ncbi:MAG: Na/Pi symporter [Gammaproteobacteria bacterium]|nr:Na/Pi symporter [Gammaproteobacteria bacterium]